MLLKIHHMTRNPVFKTAINGYKQDHEEFLQMLIHICKPSTKSRCKSIKFHQPTHWYLTRTDMGCAAMEKSLEKMLGESKKKTFKFTNSRFDIEVYFLNWLLSKCTFFTHYEMFYCILICLKCTFIVHEINFIDFEHAHKMCFIYALMCE